MIKQLSEYDFPDLKWVPDGYDMKEVVCMSDNNIQIVVDKINEVIAQLNNEEIDNENRDWNAHE